MKIYCYLYILGKGSVAREKLYLGVHDTKKFENLGLCKTVTCCSNSMVLIACLQGKIIMGKPTATDIMKPTRIISVTRLDGKFISTFPAMLSVKLT